MVGWLAALQPGDAYRGVTPGGRDSEWRSPRKSRRSPQPRVALSQLGLRPTRSWDLLRVTGSGRGVRVCARAYVRVCVRVCACARDWLRGERSPGTPGLRARRRGQGHFSCRAKVGEGAPDTEQHDPPAASLQGSGPPGSLPAPPTR